MKALLVGAIVLAACGTPAALAPPDATTTTPVATSPGPSPSMTPTPLIPGTMFTMATEPEMVDFFADRGALLARATRDGPPPYLSKIRRADAPAGPWRTLYESDAMFMRAVAAEGQMAFAEYREEPRSAGAYELRVTLLDLGTGAATAVDRFALSSATFRGGGGGPRRPVGGHSALGGGWIAWTRLIELAGGNVEGELRIARTSSPAAATVVGRSREWIEPVAIDATTLIYLVGGAERDQIRERTLASGADRLITEFAAPTQTTGRSRIVASGSLVAWTEIPPGPTTRTGTQDPATLRAIDRASGATRERRLDGHYCPLTANTRGLAWRCDGTAPAVVTYLDARTWTPVDLVRTSAQGPRFVEAVAGGFLWYDTVGGARRVTLFTAAP